MPVNPEKKIAITGKQLKALQKRLKARNLTEADYDILQGMAETIECLSQAVEEKDTSLGRLCKYLLGAPTETARNLFKNIAPDKLEQKSKPEAATRPGHGRKPAAAYTGGAKVIIDHPVLKTKDLCPECEKGKVYELSMPAVQVHITGQAPLNATVYERTRLRCNLCGQIYTPDLPAHIGDQKHDESAAAMLALLKYGCGLPLNRIEKLQANLGHPLPASSQWDILDATAAVLSPVLDAHIYLAAQGSIIHNDDTTMKILDFFKNQDPQGQRKGIFTTGIISIWQGHKIALFMTGNQHAGENLTELLKKRSAQLGAPIQMCDALSRNTSKEFEAIVSNCLTHARRQFVDIIDSFPDECIHVIETMREIYKNDAIVKEQNMSADQRLAYHQQHSKPLMDQLHQWCKKQLDEKLVEPNSGLGKAIKYLLNHWVKLTRFLEVPGAPLDNNICERGLKYAIVHRKNSLFYRSRRGAYVGDLFMSLIHTCQLAGVNPLEYLAWLLKNIQKIPDDPFEYLPWKYQPDR
jgi:transposase